MTIEPGIYFIPELIDIWKSENKLAEFINYDVVETYKDFGGIRIEDDVLVTADGFRVLGKPIPKSIADGPGGEGVFVGGFFKGASGDDDEVPYARVALGELFPAGTLLLLPSGVSPKPEWQRTWEEAAHHLEVARRRGEEVTARDALLLPPDAVARQLAAELCLALGIGGRSGLLDHGCPSGAGASVFWNRRRASHVPTTMKTKRPASKA